MIIGKGYKMEKVASKDATRPVLQHLYVRDNGDGTGTLEATDSYKLVRVPVKMEDGDTAGFLTAGTLTEARKGTDRYTDEIHVEANGHVAYTTKDGARVEMARPEPGTFPNTEQLYPAGDAAFTVGINPKFLLELAEALGSPERVSLSFVAVRDGTEPDPLRPMVVRPMNGNDGDGILMPIRIG